MNASGMSGVNFGNNNNGWSFQKISIMVALVVLSLLLLFIGVTMMNAIKNTQYPADVPMCPDYWEVGKEANVCIRPKDSTHVNYGVGEIKKGEKSLETIDKDTNRILVNFADFKGPTAVEDKCKLMKKYNITWDGLTNMNIC